MNKKFKIIVILIISFVFFEIYVSYKKKYRVNELLGIDIFEYGECVYSSNSGFGLWDEVIFRIYKINKKNEFNKLFQNKFGGLQALPEGKYDFLDAEFYKRMEGKDIIGTYVYLTSAKIEKTRMIFIYIVYDGDDEYLFICG